MMMAQPISDEDAWSPVCVIGSQFMALHPLDVIVDTNSRGNLVITDINHKIMLKVKPCNTIFHHQRLLLHADDTPIAMLRDKMTTKHKRWKVYRGDSKAKSNMIFSTKTTHAIQFNTNVKVLLKNNTLKKDACDFKIMGSWSQRNCTIHLGPSSTVIARMHALREVENGRFTKDRFKLEVHANVDYAFVVALIAVIDAMKSSTTTNKIVDVAIEAALGGVGA